MKLNTFITTITLAAVSAGTTAMTPHHLRRLKVYKQAMECGNKKKQRVTVKCKTDSYPAETTWWITEDENGKIVLKGYGYTDRMTEHEEEIDVCEDRCYTFHIKDSYKDGICCNYGEGFYEIAVNGKKVVEENGEFGEYEKKSFCVESGPVLMDPVNFQGWDGKKCVNQWDKDFKENRDYTVAKNIDLKECMARACADKYVKGYYYTEEDEGENSECHLINAGGGRFRDEEGAVCFYKI